MNKQFFTKSKLIFVLNATIFFTCNSISGQPTSIKNANSPSNIATERPAKDSFTFNGIRDSFYRTNEVILSHYAQTEREQKELEITALQDDLDVDSRLSSPTLTREERKDKVDKINQLSAEVIQLQIEVDSLYYVYIKNYVNFRKANIFPSPLRARAVNDLIYDNNNKRFRALGNAGISFGNNSGSLYSEIVSGNLGLFRVTLGTMISKSSDDSTEIAKNEEAYQRLVNNGGNTILTFEYPFAFLHSRNNDYNFISRFVAKGTADFPAFGTNTDSWAGSAMLGVDLYGDAGLSNNQLRFFANVSLHGVFGTKVFQENLGIEKPNFSFGQLSVGLVFLENFKISFIVSTISSQKTLRNKNVVIGGQVLR